ncbi:MAG: hypothetical protein ACRDOY_03255, partial [Nocardioidaceae bacterium]
VLSDVLLAGRLEGIFLSPEGAATVTAARALRHQGWLAPDQDVVLLNTGTGLIYPDAVQVDATTIPRDGRIDLGTAP